MRKFLTTFNRQSIFQQGGSLPIKEEIAALTGSMVVTEEQSCWLVCKLTSQAKYKDLTLSNLKLQLNPEIADFIRIEESVGCETDLSDEQEPLCIEPGETYEVLFKLRVDKVKNLASSFTMEDVEGLVSPAYSTTTKTNDMQD